MTNAEVFDVCLEVYRTAESTDGRDLSPKIVTEADYVADFELAVESVIGKVTLARVMHLDEADRNRVGEELRRRGLWPVRAYFTIPTWLVAEQREAA